MNWVDCTVISIQQQTVNLQNEQENEKNRRDEIKIKFHTHSNFHLKPKAQVISCSHDDATNMHRSWLTMKIFYFFFSRCLSLFHRRRRSAVGLLLKSLTMKQNFNVIIWRNRCIKCFSSRSSSSEMLVFHSQSHSLVHVCTLKAKFLHQTLTRPWKFSR